MWINSAKNIEYKSNIGGVYGNHQSWQSGNVSTWLPELGSIIENSSNLAGGLSRSGGSGMGQLHLDRLESSDFCLE